MESDYILIGEDEKKHKDKIIIKEKDKIVVTKVTIKVKTRTYVEDKDGITR